MREFASVTCPAPTMAERSAPSPQTEQQAEREFTSLLIDLYREWPVLWKVKDKDYFNKNKKNAAWEAVLTGLRVVKPNYTIDDVKKKVNGLRSNFNREYKAIEAKKKSGASADDIPEPSLWYYNDIIFIKDQIEVATTETSEVSNFYINDLRYIIIMLTNTTTLTSVRKITYPSTLGTLYFYRSQPFESVRTYL